MKDECELDGADLCKIDAYLYDYCNRIQPLSEKDIKKEVNVVRDKIHSVVQKFKLEYDFKPINK